MDTFLFPSLDSIYVRVYESKIDVMRVVIIGAEGTLYHNGLFFFDLLFNGFFPNTPPLCGSFILSMTLFIALGYFDQSCLKF